MDFRLDARESGWLGPRLVKAVDHRLDTANGWAPRRSRTGVSTRIRPGQIDGDVAPINELALDEVRLHGVGNGLDQVAAVLNRSHRHDGVMISLKKLREL